MTDGMIGQEYLGDAVYAEIFESDPTTMALRVSNGICDLETIVLEKEVWKNLLVYGILNVPGFSEELKTLAKGLDSMNDG